MVTDYKAQTNELKQIELESGIQRAQWTRSVAAPGGEVSLEILTKNVGNGAELKIELSDHSGKKYGKLKEMIVGNRHQVPVHVPEKARDALYAEVKLSKHGLKTRSPALLLIPPIEVTNLKWSAEEARRGDVLTLTADVEGAPAGVEAVISIWEHDTDSAHDLVAEFPALVEDSGIETEWEYVYFEDTDEMPSDAEVEKGYNPPEYFFRVDVCGVTADSDVLEFKDHIEFHFPEGAGKEYVLHLADGSERRGNFDGEGVARIEDLPPGPAQIEVPGAGKLEIEGGDPA